MQILEAIKSFISHPHFANIIGLILDISGAIVIFIFGLPSKIHTPPKLLLEGDITEKQEKENKIINCWAHTGLVFLILGFVFQLISNLM